MDEIMIEGRAVLGWLKQSNLKDASDVLVGCYLDDNVAEQALKIEGINSDLSIRCTAGGVSRLVKPRLLASCIVLDNKLGHPLKAAIDQALPENERQLQEATSLLKGFGVPPGRFTRTSDVFRVVQVLEETERRQLPAAEHQEEFYKIIKRADLLPFGAKVIGTWRDLSLAKKGSVSGDVLIKLAYCFRHSGQLDKALDASEVVTRHDRKVSLTHGQKAVLATERAAALLDLYNIRRDQSLLAQARRCAGIAWAIAQSNETSLVYQRLKSLE